MSTQEPATSSSSTDPAVSDVKLERKARKEAQKALKLQQAAQKKIAIKAEQPSTASSSISKSSSANASASASSSSSSSLKAPRKPPSSDEQLSRALAYILRHGAEKEALEIRADGYVLLEHVLQRPRVKSVTITLPDGKKTKPRLEDVRRIVESNEKKRFELSQQNSAEWWVRAVQGHSLKNVVELQHVALTLENLHLLKLTHDDPHNHSLTEEHHLKTNLDALQIASEHRVQVIHGTYAPAWDLILASGGLKPMTRNHIHLAKGKFGQQGVISGMRKSANRLIYIDIVKAITDGIPFYLSSNGVVLTPGDNQHHMLGVQYFTKVEDQNAQLVWSRPPSPSPSPSPSPTV